MSQKRQALGKGLGSLLGQPPVDLTEETPEAEALRQEVRYISLEDIYPNPYQPRKRFSQDALRELADSIKELGVLQPVILCRHKTEEGFFLLAGERRFRASQLAELTEIPALITEASEEEMLEIAIVENVQRNDLNAVEEANAYKQLMDQFGWSQEEVARRVGKKRSTVANSVRLLKLGDEAMRALEEGKLTAGHARALLALENDTMRQRLLNEILDQGISVREAERRVRDFLAPVEAKGSASKGTEKKKNTEKQGLDIVALEERLMSHLGCRVKIRSQDGQSGKLEVPFGNPDELQRFLDAVNFLD